MAQMYRHPTDPGAAEYRVAPCRLSTPRLLDASCKAWRDCEGVAWGPEAYRTTFRALWTADALCVRFECRDDAPWWTLTERDGRLWNEEVVENLSRPGADGERVRGDRNQPGQRRVRPQGRFAVADAFFGSEVGLGGAAVPVHMEPGDGRACWIATAVLPFDGARSLSDDASRRVPPAAGDRWRFNLFRIKRPGGAADPERDAVYAAWSVPDGPSFHAPDRFRDLVFG